MVHIPPKPKNDAEFLEVMSKIIFVSGFRWNVVEARWPKMRKAFHSFNVKKVANEKLENLLKKDGMIKNRGKISAIIENAQQCEDIIKQHGSILMWVKKIEKKYKKDPLLSPSAMEEFQRFKKIGKTTSRWLAYVMTRDKTLLRHGQERSITSNQVEA